jgi:hypothetical protein
MELEATVPMVGSIYRTPNEPSGLVCVIDISYKAFHGRDVVEVRYLENHPHGYKKDSFGCYFADELKTFQGNEGVSDE